MQTLLVLILRRLRFDKVGQLVHFVNFVFRTVRNPKVWVEFWPVQVVDKRFRILWEEACDMRFEMRWNKEPEYGKERWICKRTWIMFHLILPVIHERWTKTTMAPLTCWSLALRTLSVTQSSPDCHDESKGKGVRLESIAWESVNENRVKTGHKGAWFGGGNSICFYFFYMFCFPLGIWNPPCFHLAQELLQLNFERTNPQPWDLSLMTKYLKWSHLDLLGIFDSGLRSGTCALIHQQQKVQLPALSAQVIGNPWVSILYNDGPKGETLVKIEQPTSQWWKGTIYSRFCELTLASRECVEIEDYAMLFYLVFCPSRCKMSILKYGALKLLDRRCLVADLDRSLESAALWITLVLLVSVRCSADTANATNWVEIWNEWLWVASHMARRQLIFELLKQMQSRKLFWATRQLDPSLTKRPGHSDSNVTDVFDSFCALSYYFGLSSDLEVMKPVLGVICDMSGLRPQLSMVAQLHAVSRLSS